MAEPCAHLSGAADDQDALARAARARRDAPLLLMRQRGVNEELHDLLCELGLEPRARFVSFGLWGVDPYRMLHGNPQACAKALEKAGLSWDDISVIEVNEAFASVVLQFVRDAGLEDRMEDVNPNGGGISLGHPLGATGARITATLINELERREARYGIATMCIGFGQAIAGVIERL